MRRLNKEKQKNVLRKKWKDSQYIDREEKKAEREVKQERLDNERQTKKLKAAKAGKKGLWETEKDKGNEEKQKQPKEDKEGC